MQTTNFESWLKEWGNSLDYHREMHLGDIKHLTATGRESYLSYMGPILIFDPSEYDNTPDKFRRYFSYDDWVNFLGRHGYTVENMCP